MWRFQVKFTPKEVCLFFLHMTEWGPASNVISRLTFWHQCSTHIRAWYKLSLGVCWWWGLTYSMEYRNQLKIVSWQTLWYRNISYPKNRYCIVMKFVIYTRGSHLCFFYIQYNSTLVALLVSPLGEMFIFPFPTVKPTKPKGALGITTNVAPYCSMLYIWFSII